MKRARDMRDDGLLGRVGRYYPLEAKWLLQRLPSELVCRVFAALLDDDDLYPIKALVYVCMHGKPRKCMLLMGEGARMMLDFMLKNLAENALSTTGPSHPRLHFWRHPAVYGERRHVLDRGGVLVNLAMNPSTALDRYVFLAQPRRAFIHSKSSISPQEVFMCSALFFDAVCQFPTAGGSNVHEKDILSAMKECVAPFMVSRGTAVALILSNMRPAWEAMQEGDDGQFSNACRESSFFLNNIRESIMALRQGDASQYMAAAACHR